MESQSQYDWKSWESTKHELLKYCMEGKWENVVVMYERYPILQYAQLSGSEETALHIAVRKSTENIVNTIVEAIEKNWSLWKMPRSLGLPNDQGNTPLHVAALIGNVDMCKCIAEKQVELLGVRNMAGETPLFLAAYHGKKEAFLYLFRDTHREYCRRGKDGQTILHAAINGEYFDLAFQIICKYDELINAIDENGHTPLHLLATKPAAFRSGSFPAGFIDRIIYHCLPVKKLEEERPPLYDFRPDDHTTDTKKYPDNYKILVMIIKSIGRAMLIILVLTGLIEIEKLQAKKEKNIWSAQIMDRMLSKSSPYYHDGSFAGFDPKLYQSLPVVEGESRISFKGNFRRRETSILVAAKNGITEMVEQILEVFPMAILDRDSAGKNVVLLAVENRKIQLYELLLKRNAHDESAFNAIDTNGNSVLHVAANWGDSQAYPFAALRMQWEIKWYKYVKHSVPRNFFKSHNNENKTAKEVFRETHQILVKEVGDWLISTSNSSSVVATVVATMAFATTASIPGGIKEGSPDTPNLERHPGFIVFAIASLIALSFSVTSVIAFLSIITPTHGRKDFEKHLPEKLLYALTYLYTSLASMLVSFYAGHFLLMKDDLKHNAFLVYGIVCLPAVAFFTRRQLPFYIDLLLDTFLKVPRHKPSHS